MSAWESYSKDATRTVGGDFVVPPDDIYTCIVADVSDPVTEVNRFKKSDNDPDETTRFYVEWEIEDDLDDGQGGSTKGLTFRQYMALPEKYLDFGQLSEKSTVYQIMKALGYDMEGDTFNVNPEQWNGKRARVTTEKYVNDNNYERVKVKSLAPMRRERSRREETREPATTGTRGSVRERLRAE